MAGFMTSGNGWVHGFVHEDVLLGNTNFGLNPVQTTFAQTTAHTHDLRNLDMWEDQSLCILPQS